jgi:hypothetical protein
MINNKVQASKLGGGLQDFDIADLPIQSISTKPHQFFKRVVDNDLDHLSKFLLKKYDEIENKEVPGVSGFEETKKELWVESKSTSTIKWREYNVFQFHHDGLYNLLKSVKEMVQEACNYYEINFEDQKYMVQGWFNINYKNSGKLNWHDHGGKGAPLFHGYYSVKAEPTQTFYKTFDEIKTVENKNNVAILSETGHPHAMGDWNWEGSRITVAYDVSPLRSIRQAEEQHWFPLI